MSAFGDPGVFASFTTWPGGAEARFNSLNVGKSQAKTCLRNSFLLKFTNNFDIF